MSKNIQNVPRIRFPGFTGAWEQRKLGDMGKFGKRYSYSRADEGEGEYAHVHYGDIHSVYNGFIKAETKVPTIKSKSKHEVLTNEDIIVADASEDHDDLGKTLVIEDIDNRKLIAGLHTFNFRPDKILNSKFYLYYTQSNYYKKFIYKKATGISVLGLSKRNIENMEFKLPNIEEQKKIGTLFSILDHLIILHQHKLNNVKDLKTGLLQKMFPKKDEVFPEIRFPEFTYAWEQRKLGNLTQIKTGSSDLQDAVEDGQYPFFVRSENIERSNRYIFDGEAILIPGEGRLGEIYHYINGKFDFHQRVYKISGFEESDTDGKYILYYMQKNFKQHAMRFTVKATVDSLRLPMLTDFDVVVPKIKEQRKISDFFANLDHLITLHQRKLENLQKLKKSLLQQMFI